MCLVSLRYYRTKALHGRQRNGPFTPAVSAETPCITFQPDHGVARCGVPRCGPEELSGGSPADNAATIREVFAGTPGPKREAVLLNAAGAIAAGGHADDLREGYAAAVEAVDSGAAGSRLDELIAFSRAELVA